jgi:hypothetical protein
MSAGKLLIFAGAILLLAGLLIHFAPGLFSWFGKLPGDIRIVRKNNFIFFPITSMLIVSIVLSLIINLFFRK